MGEHAETFVHHINFLVRDVEAAAARFAGALGLDFGALESLPSRGVVLRRARAGATWIVLVQPVDSTGLPAEMLATQGEGVMLVSFAVDGLEAALERAEAAGAHRQGDIRGGLDHWRVADLCPVTLFGVPVQLVEDPDS
ncbi:MAG: VOC family protein [Pseudomonadota bacterium]